VGVFILALVILLLGLIGLVAALVMDLSPKTNKRGYEESPFIRRSVALAIAIGIMVLGGLMVFFDSFTIVPARNVGIVNTFGKAEAALDNGWHWVKPWSSVETVDATVQNINLSQDAKNCITVRLANQTTACVDVTVQWNIDQKANANELWQRYRGTNDDVVGNVGRNVVERELRRSLNVVFESYNPLSVLTGGGAPTTKTDDLAAAALGEMKQHVASGIVVDTLRISLVHFDGVTQDKLNGYAQALADTQIATQQRLTAEQQKAANDVLAQSSSSDPGVKYQNCLNLLKDLAAKGQLQNLPPTFNCAGSDTPVIVNSKGN
jgi:regulator of protease activity HflC (stomatin/prohibitin superfamily)